MYRKAIELDPSHAMAHNNLGLLLQYVRKDYDGAEKMYRKAIELDPSYATAHRCPGLLLQYVRKDHDDAENIFNLPLPGIMDSRVHFLILKHFFSRYLNLPRYSVFW